MEELIEEAPGYPSNAIVNKIRFDRTDTKEAYWCLAHFICGRLAAYQIYTRLSFVQGNKPRAALHQGPSHLTPNGKRIYMQLVRAHYG